MSDPYGALARLREHDQALGIDPDAFDAPRPSAATAEPVWRPPPPPWAENYRADDEVPS